MMRKGQTATEYLIILAVVIVIALIVVGVLGGIPGVGQSGQAKSGAAYWATTDPIAVASWSNSATNGITLIFRNNGKNAFEVTGSTFDGTNINTSTNLTLPIGSDGTITAINTVVPCTSGEKYSYDLSISYIDLATAAAYTFTGTQKLEGTCAV